MQNETPGDGQVRHTVIQRGAEHTEAAKSAVAPFGTTVAPYRWVITRLQVRARYSSIYEEVALIEAHLPSQLTSPLTRLGLVEALSNSVLHGALQVGNQLRNDGRFEEWLEAVETAEAQSPDALVHVCIGHGEDITTITMFDGGRGFDWRNTALRRGRGLQLIEQCFAAVRFNEAGNHIHIQLRHSAKKV